MKRKSLCLVLGGLILLGSAVSRGAAAPFQNKELDQFFKGKALVFAGDWPGVRSGMETYLKDYPAGKMRDEALYWLGRSLDRLARDARDVSSAVDLKRKAFDSLDRLVKEFPGSLWRDDARELQIAVAGGLAVLGAEDQRIFLEGVVGSGGKNGIEIKTAALNSIIALDSRTAIPVLEKFLKTESDAGLRKRAVALLGRKYSREITAVLEDVVKNDPDAEVRKEAGLWREKIRIRLIPVQVNYYAFDTIVTDVSQYVKVPEGKVAVFTVPHGKPGSKSRAKRAINRIFEGRVDFAGSEATMNSGALEELGASRVSHRLGGFQVELDASSIIKTAIDVAGRVRFGDLTAPFKVDKTNDVILAARRGGRQAVMFLEMAPKDIEEETEEKSSPSVISRLFSPDRGPSLRNAYQTMGMVIYSDRDSGDLTELRNSNLFDYGIAKAEIPGPGGTWTLTGQLLLMNKEKMLVGRMAKLVRPDGSIAAEGEEIRVPAGNPAGFKTGGVADTKALPASAPETGMETTYPLENGGWIRSPRPAAGAANTPGDLLDFGTAQASLPGPRGNWTLRGYLILLKSDREIMACKAVLTNPEGKTAAQGTLIFIPVKNPEKFRLTVERIN